MAENVLRAARPILAYHLLNVLSCHVKSSRPYYVWIFQEFLGDFDASQVQ